MIHAASSARRSFSFTGGLHTFDRSAYDRAERVRRCAAGTFAGAATATIGRKKNAGGGGGPSNDPTFVAAGTGAELAVSNTTGPITPGYPAGLASGDIIFLHIGSRTASSIPTTLSGWTVGYQDTITVNNRQGFLYYKTATGSESGTESITFLVNTNSACAQMTAFRNVNIAAGFEDAALTQSSAGAIAGPTIATDGVHRMCFGFGIEDSDAALTPFGAVTGGTWVERAEFSTAIGSNFTVHLQTALMSSGGTISGGSMDLADNDGILRSFVMVGT